MSELAWIAAAINDAYWAHDGVSPEKWTSMAAAALHAVRLKEIVTVLDDPCQERACRPCLRAEVLLVRLRPLLAEITTKE